MEPTESREEPVVGHAVSCLGECDRHCRVNDKHDIFLVEFDGKACLRVVPLQTSYMQ